MKPAALICTLLCLLVVSSASAIVVPPAPPNSWQIGETDGNVGFDQAIFYTITNKHATDSIRAFAVGFNTRFGTDYAITENTPGWAAASVDENEWTNLNLAALDNSTAEDFFGLTWTEFQAFDVDHQTTEVAIFNFLNESETETNLLGPGIELVGDTTYPTSLPVFIAVEGGTDSPAVVLMSGGTLSGGPAGQANFFPPVVEVEAVPEPSSLLLLLMGLLGMRFRKR